MLGVVLIALLLFGSTIKLFFHCRLLLFLRWRYSPGWALASFTIRLQASRPLALSLHSFIPIFLRSVDTSSSHFIFGLPLRLVAYSFPYIFFWNWGVLHSFYMINPLYSLAFYKVGFIIRIKLPLHIAVIFHILVYVCTALLSVAVTCLLNLQRLQNMAVGFTGNIPKGNAKMRFTRGFQTAVCFGINDKTVRGTRERGTK